MLLCATVNPFSRGAGSRFVAATKFVMRSGKTVGLSARMTVSMCSATNVQDQILIRAPGSMCLLRFGIISVFATSMSVTGSLSKSAKYRRAHGRCMEIITYSLFCDVRASSDLGNETYGSIAYSEHIAYFFSCYERCFFQSGVLSGCCADGDRVMI